MSDLRKAAEAVLERWDSPAWEWKKQGPTADLMADLRTALAAEPTKQEPVAWMFVNLDGECEQIVYGTPPTDDDSITPLYTAPPATHPGYIIGSHWLETAYSRICAGEAEADVLRDIGLIREEAFLTGVQHLRHENERLRLLLQEARGAKWLVVQDNLLDRIDAALRRERT